MAKPRAAIRDACAGTRAPADTRGERARVAAMTHRVFQALWGNSIGACSTLQFYQLAAALNRDTRTVRTQYGHCAWLDRECRPSLALPADAPKARAAMGPPGLGATIASLLSTLHPRAMNDARFAPRLHT